MPIYTYSCPVCGHFDMRQEEPCECGAIASKVLVPVGVQPDLSGYSCPITGAWIDGRKAHQENLKRHGCRVYEAGETEQFKKRQADRQRDFERRTEEIVHQAAVDINLSSKIID